MAMKIKCNQCGAEWLVEKYQYDPAYLRCPNGCDVAEAPKREPTPGEQALRLYAPAVRPRPSARIQPEVEHDKSDL
jgi:hypothetical protein